MTKAIVLAAAALVAAACSILEPREDPTRFFVLTSLEAGAPASSDAAPAATNAANAPNTAIGLGPVTLPAYLERPEMVRRSGNHELLPSRVDRWGEPLDRALQRVLADDLARITGRRVASYPWKTALGPAWTVEVDVARFEAVGEKNVELVAEVDGRSSDGTTTHRHERIEVALAGTDGGALAKAMSDAVAELARRIAAALAPAADRR